MFYFPLMFVYVFCFVVNFTYLIIIIKRLPFYRKIRQIIDTFGSHLNVELQQRGVEFSQLFRRHAPLRGALLERMPPLEIQDKANSDDANEDVVLHLNGDDNSTVNSPTSHRIEEEVKFIIILISYFTASLRESV